MSDSAVVFLAGFFMLAFAGIGLGQMVLPVRRALLRYLDELAEVKRKEKQLLELDLQDWQRDRESKD